MKKLFLFVSLLSSFSVFATPYSLEGYTIDAYIERTLDPSGFYGLGRINGYGLDAPFEVKTGTEDTKQYSEIFTLDVDKDRFTINFISAAGWADGTIFRIEQPDYASTTKEGFWYGLGSDTNIDGLMFGQGIDIGFGWVQLNLGNTRFDENSYFIGYFNYQDIKESVPEPSSYLLLLVGLLCMYLKSRSKTKARNSNT